MRVATGAVCEWLPQESIVFDGALGRLDTHFCLAGDASLIAADMLCLGRVGSGERFRHGQLALTTRVSVDGRPVWLERGRLDGGGRLLDSPVGLNGHPVSAALLVKGPAVDEGLRDACRELACEVGECGVTLLPDGL
ncbi:urease accessory protein UreD, partial [Arthrospira platensis SPKY2]